MKGGLDSFKVEFYGKEEYGTNIFYSLNKFLLAVEGLNNNFKNANLVVMSTKTINEGNVVRLVVKFVINLLNCDVKTKYEVLEKVKLIAEASLAKDKDIKVKVAKT